MKQVVMALVLLMSGSAMAGLFDSTAESTVKYLYKQAEKGNLEKFVKVLSGEAKEQFGNEEGSKIILADLERGKIVTSDSLLSETKNEEGHFRKYHVNAFAKDGSTKTLVREFELECKVTRFFSCHHGGGGWTRDRFSHCSWDEYENCSVISISK